MMTGIGWGMSLVGGLWMVGGLLLVVAVGVLAVRRYGAPAPAGVATSLDALRERYARGEMSQADFEQARRALGYA